MRPGSSYNQKRNIMAANSIGSKRKRPQGTMLLLALGAAVLCVVAFHNMRERRVVGILLHDRDHQVLAMQLLLEERRNLNEMKRKMVGLKMKMSSLATQKSELHAQLMEAEARATHACEIQREKETAIAAEQNDIDALGVSTPTELLKQKEAELKLHLVNRKSNGSVEDSEERSTKLQETQLETQKKDTKANNTTEETTDSNTDEEMNGEEKDVSKKGKWVMVKTNADNIDMKDGEENDDKQTSIGIKKSQENGTSEISKDEKQSENVELMSFEKQATSLNGREIQENAAETKGKEITTRSRHETRTRRKRRRKRSIAKEEEETKNEENGNKEFVSSNALEDTNDAAIGDTSKERKNVEQKQTDSDEGKQEDGSNKIVVTEKPTISINDLQKTEDQSKEEISDNLEEHIFNDSSGTQTIEDHDYTEKEVTLEETDSQNKVTENEKESSDTKNSKTLSDSSTSSADAASKTDEEAAKDAADQHNEM